MNAKKAKKAKIAKNAKALRPGSLYKRAVMIKVIYGQETDGRRTGSPDGGTGFNLWRGQRPRSCCSLREQSQTKVYATGKRATEKCGGKTDKTDKWDKRDIVKMEMAGNKGQNHRLKPVLPIKKGGDKTDKWDKTEQPIDGNRVMTWR